MKLSGRVIVTFVLSIVIGLGGCGNRQQEPASPKPDDQSTPVKQARTFEKIRGPAVAGSADPKSPGKLWYPRHAETLTKMIDGFLAEADPEPVENLRALICPHAGYEYSGKVAAFGYKLLKGRDIETVIIFAPTHTATFEGASIPDVDAYETPLGMIPLSSKAAELGKFKPFVVNPPCEVRRPGFWQISPKELPPFGEETPHTWEWSLEAQLPFLQSVLKDFELVPVVFGQNLDYEAVARVLVKHLDDKTLLVASSDLSHYLPYDLAKGTDTTSCRAICSLRPVWVEHQDPCGSGPIAALIYVARKLGWKAKLIDYRNSGDTTGDTSRGVVGYAAIAFYEPDGSVPEEKAPAAAPLPDFTPPQREFLLQLARKTVHEAIRVGRPPASPEWNLDGVPQDYVEARGCFVTLKKHGQLRGCTGSIFPQRPFYQAVMFSAFNAAVNDRRFLQMPIRRDELAEIDVEVSVLTMPRRLEFRSPGELLEKLRPHVDGVVLRVGSQESTYLPQVWEDIPDKEEFLNHLAEKAGLSASGWKSPEARVLVYQVEAFKESER